MTTQHFNSQELTVLLQSQAEEIYTTWMHFLQQRPERMNLDLSVDKWLVLINHMMQGVIETFENDHYDVLNVTLNELYQMAHESGSDVAFAIDAILFLKKAIMSKLRGTSCQGTPSMLHACDQLDSFLRYSVSYLAKKHTDETSLHLLEEHQRTIGLLEIVKTAASTLDLDEVLKRVGEAIMAVTKTEQCGFSMSDKDRGLLVQKKTFGGISPLQYDSDTFVHPMPLDNLDAFENYILEKKEPIICSNTENDPRIIHEWAEMYGVKSVLAVPFLVEGEVIAIVYAFTQEEYREFSQEQVDLAWGIANAVALAIENARLHNKTREIAVMEERDRLARELHDNLAQILGSMQLKASQISSFTNLGQLQKTLEYLSELQDMISAASIDVRETIFNMRTMYMPSVGFLATLQQYLDTYRNRYRVEVELFIDDCVMEDLEGLEGEIGVQAMRIIQESLTNIRKHAKISRAAILIMRYDSQIEITMYDHGCGFDPAYVMNQAGHHIGLQVMQERAESIGGRLTIISQPGHGTAVTLTLPTSID